MKKVNYDELDESIIWFTAIDGHGNGGSNFFHDYIVSYPNGVAWKILEKLPRKKYGEGVESILFMLHIEGDVDWFEMPKKCRLGPFGKTSKGWRFKIPLTLTQQNSINTLYDMQEFIANIIIELVNILKKRKNIPDNFNFNLFIDDCLDLIEDLKKYSKCCPVHASCAKKA